MNNKKKSIYIANVRFPTEKAHGYQIAKMAEAFASHGLGVELIVPRRFNHIKDDPFNYYQIERSFKVKRLPCLDLIPLGKYIGHLGFWVQELSFCFFAFFYLLFKKADIFYTRDLTILPLSLLKKNIFFEAHKFPGHYFLYAFWLKKVKGIITVTDKLKQLFVQKGIKEDKILVAPDGVDLKIFDLALTKEEARKKLNLPLDKKIIGYFGRFKTMEMEKGVAEILQSLRWLPAVVFLAVGGTKNEIDYYGEKAKNLGVGERVIFIERVAQKMLAQYQKACDVLVMPFPYNQHYALYMSPVKMFEHMAAKRPIVASDLPSLREVLNNKNAVLVKPAQPQALAQGVKRLLGNKNLAEQISTNAFKDVQEYSWQKRTRKILEFIV